MHEFQTRLLSYLKDGKTLIMPTEESARSILTYLVQSSEGKAFVRKSQAIAYDRFRDSIFPEKRNLVPADRISRLLFASFLVKTRKQDLRYFIPSDEYPEIDDQMMAFIANLLPSLKEADRLETDENARHDIYLIRSEYDRFLDRCGMYERSFCDDAGDIQEMKDHYVVLSSTSPEETIFMESLRDKLSFDDPEDGELPPLVLYDNERQEIRNTFLQIRRLIDSGVDLSEIAITTAGYGRLRPYLESESYLFSVPISFRRGLSPLNYPAGSFIRLLRTLHENEYRIEDLKVFFLNPSFPFRDPEAGRTFILESISRSIRQKETRKDRYFSAEKGSMKVYSDLLHYNRNINTTSDPDYMIREIKSLMEKLFTPEQFSTVEEDERVLSFILREASNFSSTARILRDNGYMRDDTPVFPLFLKYLENSIYVPQEKMEGVKVYPLGQSNALPMKYHFVMSLNEKEARNTYQEASFLSDYEIRKLRREDDSTRAVMQGLNVMGENVIFSASSNTYEGYALALTEFSKIDKPEMLEDAYSEECDFLRYHKLTGSLFEVQRKSYEAARKSALAAPGWKEDMTCGLRMDFPGFNGEEHGYSVSQVDTYIRCPYRYALEYVYGLRKSQSYEVEDFPYFEVGSRLHKVVEDYFSDPGDLEEKVPRLLNAELDLWEERQTVDRNGEVKALSPDVQQLTPPLRAYIYSKYLDGLVESIRYVESLEGEVELEKKVEGLIAGLRFSGFIDCLVHLGDRYRILDFKSASIPTDSLQLEIYRTLTEGGDETYEASEYLALKTAEHKPKKEMLTYDELVNVLKDVDERLASGDFKAANTADACEGCAYRGICRRRFYIQ